MTIVPRALIPAVLAAVLLAGGCSDAPSGEPETTREPASRTTRSPDAAPSSPTAKPTPDQQDQGTQGEPGRNGKGAKDGGRKIAPSALPMARPDGSRTHLLTAETMPPAGNAGWTVAATGPESSRRVGACQQASLVDIGALHAVIRVFTGPGDDGPRSRQLVARFADGKSAWRAHEVLRTWRAECEDHLDRPRTDVGPMERVDLDSARAGHYRASFGPKKDTDAAGLGIVRAGRWLSVVEITSAADDFPDDWTRRAVRRIAATFGS